MGWWIGWNLLIDLFNLKEYFKFWKIHDEKKVWLAFNKLDGEAREWWEDIQIEIQIDRKHWGMHPILSWQRMKKLLVDLWFIHDYYDMLYNTMLIIDCISYEEEYVETWKANHKTKIITSKSMCQETKRVWGLRRCNKFLKKILKWLKKIKSQDLQQVV